MKIAEMSYQHLGETKGISTYTYKCKILAISLLNLVLTI